MDKPINSPSRVSIMQIVLMDKTRFILKYSNFLLAERHKACRFVHEAMLDDEVSIIEVSKWDESGNRK